VSGRHVLITGGSSGLGACLAEAYRNAGDHVTIADVAAPQVANCYVHFDCGKPDFSWIEDVARFDIVICNAGISNSEDFVRTDSAVDELIMRVNTLGHMALIRMLLTRGKIRSGGRVAFIVSATQWLPFPIAIAYAASKGALDGFAHALEAYVVGQDITITRVYPGPMRTPHAEKYYARFNRGKGTRPPAIARRIVTALEKRKRRVLPDRIAILCYIGSSLCPRLLCRLTYYTYFRR
jgi:NAD(P)-dependent dehydrogenase (short-subunit alcohol dehydrogenase family)